MCEWVISWRKQVNYQWDDDEIRFVLNQHAELDFYSASSLKQQSMGRHVAPLKHIILIPNQPVFALSPECCMLSGEATNTNFIVFDLTRPVFEPTIYRTRGEHANHYATDAGLDFLILQNKHNIPVHCRYKIYLHLLWNRQEKRLNLFLKLVQINLIFFDF